MCVVVEGMLISGLGQIWAPMGGGSPALLCKACVSSLTRPLNTVHRWLIKTCGVRQPRCTLIVQLSAVTNTITCAGAFMQMIHVVAPAPFTLLLMLSLANYCRGS